MKKKIKAWAVVDKKRDIQDIYLSKKNLDYHMTHYAEYLWAIKKEKLTVKECEIILK